MKEASLFLQTKANSCCVFGKFHIRKSKAWISIRQEARELENMSLKQLSSREQHIQRPLKYPHDLKYLPTEQQVIPETLLEKL